VETHFRIGPLLLVGPSREPLAARALKRAERAPGACSAKQELEAGDGVGARSGEQESSSMSSSSSCATSRFENSTRMEMPIFLCPRCWTGIDRRLSRTPKNTNRPFYVCSMNGVRN
jgi:hypothetical protein